MKKLFTTLFFIVYVIVSKAQLSDISFNKNDIKIDPETRRITYSIIDTVPGASKDALYSRALEWITTNFNNPNNVTKLKDKDAGKIIVKGLSRETIHYWVLSKDWPLSYSQHFSIDFAFKEGRYKVQITDFVVNATAGVDRTDMLSFRNDPIEGIFNKVPAQYNYDDLKRSEKQQLSINKQALKNSHTQGVTLIASIHKYMKNVSKKDDW